MTQNVGTRVIAPIVTNDSDDTYPTHLASSGRGGHRTVSTLSEMNSIPAERREAGMLVYCVENSRFYSLANNLMTFNELPISPFQTGSWSPRIIGTMTNGTVIYTNRTAFFSRSGNTAMVQGRVTWTGGTGGSGNLLITDLPFTPAFDGIGQVRLQNMSFIGSPYIFFLQGVNGLYVSSSQSNGPILIRQWEGSGDLFFTASYII